MFKDVPSYRDLFMVNTDGQVFSKRTNKILKQGLTKTGYLVISSRIGGREGKSICVKVHRMVAEAFIPNTEDLPFVNHINGVKTDNTVDNLEWITARGNVLHAIATGLTVTPKGIDSKKSPLTRVLVDKILDLKLKGLSQRAIAQELNLGRKSIMTALKLYS
jgi:hypothetical protein